MTLRLENPAQTEALGRALARALASRRGLALHLSGELGTGKTTFARALLRELGATGTIKSPTYTLIETYHLGGRDVLHMDLYRLKDPAELDHLGLADYPPSETWWLIEWPEQGGSRLPPPDLALHLTHAGTGRAVQFAVGPDLADAWPRIAATLGGALKV